MAFASPKKRKKIGKIYRTTRRSGVERATPRGMPRRNWAIAAHLFFMFELKKM